MPDSIVEMLARHAAEQPGHIAYTCGDRTVTFAGLAEQTRQFAAGLAALGLRRGERVLICLPAGIDAVIAVLGTVRAAGVGVPVDPRSSTAELAGLVDDCRPGLVVAGLPRRDGGVTVADVLAAAAPVPPATTSGPASRRGSTTPPAAPGGPRAWSRPRPPGWAWCARR